MNKSEAGKLGAEASKEAVRRLKQERIERYNKNPKLCKCCGKPIPYQHKQNKFCNSSCSAVYNNTHRARKTCKAFKCLNCGAEHQIRKNSKNKFCNIHCQSEYQYKEYIKRWKRGEENGISGSYGLSRYIRRYLLEKADFKCERCGWSGKNPYTGQYVLEIHHKDGNYKNNNEDNLEVLCLNCHGMTKNYKSRNKCGRKERKKYSNN